MSDLQVIREAYDKVGICYVVREKSVWSYLFLCNERNRQEYETSDIEGLCRRYSFMEFLHGAIASY